MYLRTISAKTNITKDKIKRAYFFKKIYVFSFLYINKKQVIIVIKGIYNGEPNRLEKFCIA